MCLLCLASCGKTDPVEPGIQMLYGDYTLSDIHWLGLSVNLNDDDMGYWDLLYEFQNIIGYYEPDYTVVINDGITYSYTKKRAKNDPADFFLSNILDISLVADSYDSNTFRVGLHCKLPCGLGDSKTLNENYLYYEFKKK